MKTTLNRSGCVWHNTRFYVCTVNWSLVPVEEQQSQTSSSSSFISHFSFNRIHLKGYSGTAGKTSSIGQPGSDFSTKDADNDKCVCKCSQLSSGGNRQFVCVRIVIFFSVRKIHWRFTLGASSNTNTPTGPFPKHLQKPLKGSSSSAKRLKSTISSELITDQLIWEFSLYNGWH